MIGKYNRSKNRRKEVNLAFWYGGIHPQQDSSINGYGINNSSSFMVWLNPFACNACEFVLQQKSISSFFFCKITIFEIFVSHTVYSLPVYNVKSAVKLPDISSCQFSNFQDFFGNSIFIIFSCVYVFTLPYDGTKIILLHTLFMIMANDQEL